MKTANQLKANLNSTGQNVIVKFDEGIHELQKMFTAGDMKGLSSNFKTFGEAGMGRLERLSNDACLQRVFHVLAELDDSIAEQLEEIQCIDDAKVIVCNILKFKAKQIDECIQKPPTK